jgi:zinc protease
MRCRRVIGSISMGGAVSALCFMVAMVAGAARANDATSPPIGVAPIDVTATGAPPVPAAAVPPVDLSATATSPPPVRRPGPAGSLIIVEPSHTLPIVHVVAAVRAGSGWDPHKKEGLAYLAAQSARRGAARQSRVQLDARLDALGAALEVAVDPDSTRFEGDVLARNLEPFLGILADVLLRPDFDAAEVARTRRDTLARIDDEGNDDVAVGQRHFGRNLYGDHPYGYPTEGTRASLARVRREDLRELFKTHVVGGNLIFAAAGDITPEVFSAALGRRFARLPAAPAGGPNPLAVREPQGPRGWRIQIVDKPDRQQAQIFFGQLAVKATDPDYVPLLLATTSFGGHGMTATLMDEIRSKRSLAYGAYMDLSERLGRGALGGWAQSSTAKAVPTLKLVLKLFVGLMEKGIDAGRLEATKTFLQGVTAADMDDPGRRLDARVTAEVAGLPPAFVDELPARVRAATLPQVNAAIARHVRAHDLAITIVATAATLWPRLLEAGIQPGAVDVVPYDVF